MHKSFLLAATVIATALPSIAQGCAGAALPQQFSNRELFGSDFYYQTGAFMFDLDSQVGLSIHAFSTWSYDQGVGNPVVPTQVGGTGLVDFYICPTTRVGSETLNPATPGGPWVLLGQGVITIAAEPVESQIVFSTPISFPVGQWGVALVLEPTTTGPNPGLVQHTLALAATPTPVSDQFLTMSNEFIQATAWAGTAGGNPNLRMVYDVPATAAHNDRLGDGCYSLPQSFYQWFPASVTPADIANTAQHWAYVAPVAPFGAHYVLTPGSTPHIPSSSPSLTLTAPGSTSSGVGNWDDALSTPIALPFTFNYPGGSTNNITIDSNGFVYLDSVVDSSYAICAASYGAIAPFKDGPARIAPFWADFDPTAGGTINYDVYGNFVVIQWNAVPEWPATANTNTIQVILYDTGDVDVTYGNLSNESVANGNDAVYGFTPGNGTPLSPAIDISVAISAVGGYVAGNNSIPPILTSVGRAVLGTTPTLVTSNLTAGTVIGVMALGSASFPVPVDLAVVGMPGCFLQSNFFILLTEVVNPISGNFEQPLPVPNTPSLVNATVVSQTAPFTPGFNALGFLISNGLCQRVGDQ